jgi:cold shock CspA family protein
MFQSLLATQSCRQARRIYYQTNEVRVSDSDTYIGKVKFVSDRGFLFLVLENQTGPDVFGHIREWEAHGLREPEQGERYEFEIEQRPKGPMAIKPRPVM